MTKNGRLRLSGTVAVPLPPELALDLFTPSGERAWVAGWDPLFPEPVENEVEAGTVFTTGHGGRRSVWVVTRHRPGKSVAYAVVTAGERAGTVAVACRPCPGGAIATVTYRLTALTPAAVPALALFGTGFGSFLASWQEEIAAALRPG